MKPVKVVAKVKPNMGGIEVTMIRHDNRIELYGFVRNSTATVCITSNLLSRLLF